MAGLAQSSVVIGEFEYECTLLPVVKGHELRWELIALLGDSLMSALMQVVKAEGSAVDAEVDSVVKGLASVFQKLDPKFVWRLQQTFIGSTRYRGAGGEWQQLSRTAELHFAGRYHELDQLTWHHLRQNYLPFLDGSDVWRGLVLAGQQALSGAKSRSISSAIGTSGASSATAG